MDELYEWIGQVERARAWLNGVREKNVALEDLAEFVSAIVDLTDLGSVYNSDLPRTLGLSPSVIRKFTRFEGVVPTVQARIMVERTLAYLRSLDQQTSEPTDEIFMPVPPPPTVRFEAIEWASIAQTKDNKRLIDEVSRILEKLLGEFSTSNNAQASTALTQIERDQLIAILKTALKLLEAPILEKSLFLQLRQRLQKAASNAAEKKTQEGLETLANQAVSFLSELLRSLL